MGREVRRVPADWEHPKDSKGHYRPLFDLDFETAMQSWLDELQVWRDGEYARVRAEYPGKYPANEPLSSFVHWNGGVPDPAYHRPRWTPDEATHYQLYENVSEGTPLSPVFATPAQLVDHLVAHGDGLDQPVSRSAAEAFVREGYVPSLMIIPGQGIFKGVEIAGVKAKK